VRLAGPVLDDLCERIGETVALAMWGNHGATCVRWVEAGGPVTVTLRTGVVLPLTSSATGLAFAAFYRSPYLRKMLDAEVQAAAEARKAPPAALLAALTVQLDEIRQHGIARASGSVTPGINGFSAPVFDHSGRMVAAITSLGIIGNFDLDWDSPMAQSTREAAARSRDGSVMAAAKARQPERVAGGERSPRPPARSMPRRDCRPGAAPVASRRRSPRRFPATPRASQPASPASI
jgi:DNA-binding IclR family transcriptional regulator